jgi:sensor c-di-GMP phosphodiesterase-like protein
MTEYQKTEWLHSQLSELIEGNELPIDELKIMQSFMKTLGKSILIKTETLGKSILIKMET